MKIRETLGNQTTKPLQNTQSGRNTPKTSSGGADVVSVSSEASELAAMVMEQMKGSGSIEETVDAARIEELRLAMEDGSYKLDPDASAAAILRQELGGEE